MTVRLWVNDVDYGTMSEKAGRMYAEVAQQHGDICRLEPVGEDAPDFLPKEDGSNRNCANWP